MRKLIAAWLVHWHLWRAEKNNARAAYHAERAKAEARIRDGILNSAEKESPWRAD